MKKLIGLVFITWIFTLSVEAQRPFTKPFTDESYLKGKELYEQQKYAEAYRILTESNIDASVTPLLAEEDELLKTYCAFELRLKDAQQKKAVYDRIAAQYPNAAERDKVLANYGLDINTINADIDTYTSLCEFEKTDARLEEYKNILLSGINLDVSDGSVVYVKYDNDHWFVLNYNDFAVTVVSPVDGTTPIKVGAKSYFDSNANA